MPASALVRSLVNYNLTMVGKVLTEQPEELSDAFAADILAAAVKHYPFSTDERKQQLVRMVESLRCTCEAIRSAGIDDKVNHAATCEVLTRIGRATP